MAGSREDVETVRAFFQDLRARGLGDPLLVVSDGAPGIIRAIEECFPRSTRQRCLAHRMRNLAAKVPTDPWPEFKARVTACYQAPSRAIARQLAAGIRADLLDEQRHATGALADTLDHVDGKARPSAISPILRAIEGAQRDDGVVGAQPPWRSELGTSGREDEQRRLTHKGQAHDGLHDLIVDRDMGPGPAFACGACSAHGRQSPELRRAPRRQAVR
jgi:Transposase, Mutator family